MKKIILLLSFLTLSLGSLLTQAQDLQVPAGTVIRTANCVISDDRFSFDDVVERARALEFDENDPDSIFFRRPIYLSADYTWDLQIALYYPSYTEMVTRRVAAGNDAYGRLPISCDAGRVVRSIPINDPAAAGDIENQTAMLTRFCSYTESSSLRSAYSRFRTASENFSNAGNDALMAMWVPGLGGPVERNWDFVLSEVGPEVTERLDMFANGYRPFRNNAEPAFSCNRPSMWVTAPVLQQN
ncbi:MAG: hypothetical protein ACJZ8R_10560 [Pseudohongiellaceae bacterium]|uniref:Uncharacterized protein n=1 Tax=OM182 bacterium MED-G28 TaxID=1986256 RepID=A0A2A5W874_9GAMM|nr:MAG: hypothetical protein CNF02_12005 [OM182 bacterium MED-G28]